MSINLDKFWGHWDFLEINRYRFDGNPNPSRNSSKLEVDEYPPKVLVVLLEAMIQLPDMSLT